MTITRERKDKYLKESGVKCMYCGSEKISGCKPTVTDAGVILEVCCDDCGNCWLDIYTLTDVVEDL